ncbi:MAG: hypothetical protein AB1416_02550 [Actinomycetota bacterium]
MNDDERAFRHYDEPAHREPAPGPARKLPTPPRTKLSEYVPIRLSTDVMNAIREHAHADGLTVSAWIRQLIQRELDRAEDPAARLSLQAVQVERAVDAILAKLQDAERRIASSGAG